MTTLSTGSLSRHDRMLASVFPLLSGHPFKSDTVTFERDRATNAAAWELLTHWLENEKVDFSGRHGSALPADLNDTLSFLLVENNKHEAIIALLLKRLHSQHEEFVKPALDRLWSSAIPCSRAAEVISETLKLLQSAQRSGLQPLDIWLNSNRGDSQLLNAVTTIRAAAFAETKSIALHSLPVQKLSKTLSYVLNDSLCAWLLPATGNGHRNGGETTLKLLSDLQETGLGNDFGQRAYAHAMNAVIDAYVESPAMKVDWVGRQSTVNRLRQWIGNSFVPAARDGLRALTVNTEDATMPSDTIEWENTAIERLARHRMRGLFGYIQAWDHSVAAILDLKEYMHTSESKVLLAKLFTEQMSRRLLHAGATTSELLGIYISVISAFKVLDPRGVLLDKVATPLRSYLRQREDSVRIIAASFLADVDEDGNVINPSDDLCKELAREIALSEGQDLQTADVGLDWDDMEWVPDPIDAGPDYKKSKSEDIISFMLTLFEQADFIKEVQAMLGERLLNAETEGSELEKEIRLVELFRGRFGAEKLQACEVMLRDMLDSTRINNTLRPADTANFPTVHDVHDAIPEEGISLHELIKIFQPRLPRTSVANQEFIKIMKEAAISDRTSQLLIPRHDLPSRGDLTSAEKEAQFSTKIISSFFWPELREDTFEIPKPIADLQQRFAEGFERIKNLRKLHWLSALGRATVELELDDRTVKIEAVQTWQASVIYAFQDVPEGMNTDEPVTRTIDELAEALSMDEVLVRNAVAFWAGHRVLVEGAADTYTVLERLPSADEEEAAAGGPQTLAPPPQDAAISAVKSQDAVLQDNKEMYQLFMVGMLTNGGAMDPARITMMMKMVCPGGFAFGEDETKWLLADLVEQGKAVNNGASYSIKK